jgi:hypothetical protein
MVHSIPTPTGSLVADDYLVVPENRLTSRIVGNCLEVPCRLMAMIAMQ